MAVRSKSLHMGSSNAGTTATLYTVPTGYRTILKSITVYNTFAGVNLVQLNIVRASATLSIYVVICAAAGGAGAQQQLLPWIVLNEGDSFTLTIGHNAAYWTISGTELLL